MRGAFILCWVLVFTNIGYAQGLPSGQVQETAFSAADGSLLLSRDEVFFQVDGPPAGYDAETPVEAYVGPVSCDWMASCHAEAPVSDKGIIPPARIFFKNQYIDQLAQISDSDDVGRQTRNLQGHIA